MYRWRKHRTAPTTGGSGAFECGSAPKSRATKSREDLRIGKLRASATEQHPGYEEARITGCGGTRPERPPGPGRHTPPTDAGQARAVHPDTTVTTPVTAAVTAAVRASVAPNTLHASSTAAG